MYCSNCGKEIAEGVNFCPNCGFSFKELTTESNSPNPEELKCPEFPSDLSLGKGIINWIGDATISGEYRHDRNVVYKIPEGKATVSLHQNGITFIIAFKGIFRIHSSQIIDMRESSEIELAQINKSVIGRATVGGLLFGPFGAIIGGMSGIGSKSKRKDSNLLIISYWDIETRKPISLIVTTDKLVTPFIKRYEKEVKKQVS